MSAVTSDVWQDFCSNVNKIKAINHLCKLIFQHFGELHSDLQEISVDQHKDAGTLYSNVDAMEIEAPR